MITEQNIKDAYKNPKIKRQIDYYGLTPSDIEFQCVELMDFKKSDKAMIIGYSLLAGKVVSYLVSLEHEKTKG
jgi:hypothetical protein